MAIQVRIPTVLRKHTDGEATVEVEGSTLAEIVEDVERKHPGFRERVLDDDGNLHRFINVYVNDEDVRYLDALDTKIGADDTVSILPAVAGG